MEKIKATWPGWDVVRVIGQGSFGAVYEIQRQMFGKVESAALKVITIPQHKEEIDELRSEGYDDASLTTHFRSYLEDIAREYALMLDIKGHTNVVYCDDVRYIQHDDGIGWDVYIKMELLSPLVGAMAKGYSEQETIKLGMDMCNALILCKNENIIHRDIKPQNIFVSKTGDYKLGDFGVAKIADKTVSGTKIGTFKYMAPEVYKSQPYGTSSDLYSLGLVLYWAMNERRTPFLPLPPQIPTPSMDEEARQRRFSGEPIPAPVNGSEELKRIVLKACAYNPADRFEDPTQMRDALAKLQMASWNLTMENEEKTVGTFGGARFAAPAPVEEEKTVGTFGGNRYAAPAPVEEEKTVGTFGGNRYAAPTPVEEEKTVGTFGGNRQATPAPLDDDEHTVGAFGNRTIPPVAPVKPLDDDDHTVGAFGNRTVPPVAPVKPLEDDDHTVGAFGTRTVTPQPAPQTPPVTQAPPVQTPKPPIQPQPQVQAPKPPIQPQPQVQAPKPPIQPQPQVQAPKPPVPEQPKTTAPAWASFVDGSAPNPEQPPKAEGAGWETPGVTTTKPKTTTEQNSNKTLFIVLGAVVGAVALALIIWFNYSGWMTRGGDTFYIDHGKKTKGIAEIGSNTYFFHNDGRLGYGWQYYYGEQYYTNSMGIICTGWQKIDGNTYYFDKDGAMFTGWGNKDGKNYYFDDSGIMLTGWQTIDDLRYCFDDEGVLITGWVNDEENNYYYFDPETGAAMLEWQTIDEIEYYFDPETGIMATGWQTINEQVHAFNDEGKHLLGWVVDDDGEYYMDPNNGGARVTGKWMIDGAGYYFFPETGLMATGSVQINDYELCVFNDEGQFLYRDITDNEVWGEWSEEQVTFTNYNGGKSNASYKILDNMIVDCRYLHVEEESAEVTKGNPDGTWRLYIRNENGEWVGLDTFEVKDGVGSLEYVSEEGFAFDAFTLIPYNTEAYSGSSYKRIVELRYRDVTFGEVDGTN